MGDCTPFFPSLGGEIRAQNRSQYAAPKAQVDRDLAVDATYIKVRGKWTSLSTTNRHGKTLDFRLSARRFFKQAIATNGQPGLANVDKSGSTLAGLRAVTVILKFQGNWQRITIRQKKDLNNILAQDHRFFKRITGPMLGFKAIHSATATLAGIQTADMIRKGQFDLNGLSALHQFAEFAA